MSRVRLWCSLLLPVLFVLALLGAGPAQAPPRQAGALRLAAIGDYGWVGTPTQEVAALVKSWQPDLVITLGDNNYPDGEAATIDAHIGQYYHDFIAPYQGSYGAGASENRFFPTLGNHDWHTPNAQPYLDYFTLPGNERYYDIVRGPVHLFALDSDPHEPDGNSADSVQARWLAQRLSISTAPWQLVYFHHPPYTSSQRGPVLEMRWPFAQWGADAVLAGHDHIYERLEREGIPYLVNGLGGRSIYQLGEPVAGSLVRYNQDYGALLIEATDTTLRFRFINRQGQLIDELTLTQPAPVYTLYLPTLQQ